ncbi:hypothetical protein [Wenyingzhuangia sp. IMCC45574]
MSTKEDIQNYISNLKAKFELELPKVSEEISVYERKLAQGTLTPNPIPGPQFNE